MNFELQYLRWGVPLAVLILTLGFAFDHVRRRRGMEQTGDLAMMALMTGGLVMRRRVLRAVFFTAAVALCVAALARPTSPGEAEWRQRGIDIVFVHDFSASMLARDVYPDRLERSLVEARRISEVLVADRIANVVFAGGVAHFPLTQDHQAAQLMMQGLSPRDLPPGSNLGLAVRVATCILRSRRTSRAACDEIVGGQDTEDEFELRAEAPLVMDRARAIVIFSDGADDLGTALAAVEAARRQSIEVYVVGVGTPTGERVPRIDGSGGVVDVERNEAGEPLISRLGLSLLRDLAATEGEERYYSLGVGRWQGDRLVEALGLLKRGDLDRRVVKARKHIFQRFLFPAFLLLILEACYSERRKRTRLPGTGGRGSA